MVRIFLVFFALIAALPASATEAGWALLRNGGHVVLLRNAYAQGTTEPANFDIGNCRTQHNLTERGRQQARKIGSLVAARAAPAEEVVSSRLCRAFDTARIAFGERNVEQSEMLDPPSVDAAKAAAQKAALMKLIGDYSGSGNLFLVTDISVIVALTERTPREGEAVIVRAEGEGLHVLGRIVF